MFNSDQAKSMIRMLLQWFFGTTVGVGVLAAMHINPDDNFYVFAGGLVAGVGAWAWSMLTHKTA